MNFPASAGNLSCEAHMAITPEQLLEQALVLRSQLGDEAAFAELLAAHGPRLRRFTERMLQSDPTLVADLTQETWLAIFRALPGLRDAGKFRPWAFRIARDRIYREYRRRRLPVAPLDDALLAELPVADETATAADREELELCLDALSPEHREALVLRFLEDFSYEDIARATGATVGTVRSRIHYGKRALRATWEGRKL